MWLLRPYIDVTLMWLLRPYIDVTSMFSARFINDHNLYRRLAPCYACYTIYDSY